MINLKRGLVLSLCGLSVVLSADNAVFSQDRERVVRTVSSRPTNQPAAQPQAERPASLSSSAPVRSTSQRPVLTDNIVVAEPSKPLVKKTGESSPLTVMARAAGKRSMYSSVVTNSMLGAIQKRLGIPYLYGSTGPNRYDCSGFVWAVFNDAGINFTRQSARSLWAMSEPVIGDERFEFGTLVFMNKLGHMGIVADENGFYHASSSKGITYSPFKGYWEKRIVGFRRLVMPDPHSVK